MIHHCDKEDAMKKIVLSAFAVAASVAAAAVEFKAGYSTKGSDPSIENRQARWLSFFQMHS